MYRYRGGEPSADGQGSQQASAPSDPNSSHEKLIGSRGVNRQGRTESFEPIGASAHWHEIEEPDAVRELCRAAARQFQHALGLANAAGDDFDGNCLRKAIGKMLADSIPALRGCDSATSF